MTMWQSKYDANIDQMYFVNDTDGSIHFDLPCEVKTNKKGNFLSRVSSRISIRRKLSRNGCPLSSAKSVSAEVVSPQVTQKPEPVGLVTLDHHDSFMFEDALRFDDSDASTISSSESIQSFYEPLPTCQVYYDDCASVFYDEKSLEYSNIYEKEQERLELRLQILRELY